MNNEELKEFVQNKVRDEIRAKINAPKNPQLEEGWGQGVLKATAMVVGAAVVLPVAFWASVAVGGSLAAIVASAGFINAAAIVGGVVGTSSALAIIGAGGKIGLHVGRKVTKSDTTDASLKLVDITTKRDAVTTKLAADNNPNPALEKKAADLTEQQIKAGKELEKVALSDFRKGLNTMEEYSKLRDVAMVAKLGKLTYLK